MKKNKLTKEQKEKLSVVMAWYVVAWTNNIKYKERKQEILGKKVAKLIEDIIL